MSNAMLESNGPRGGNWKRPVFTGIGFRFQNENLVRNWCSGRLDLPAFRAVVPGFSDNRKSLNSVGSVKSFLETLLRSLP